MEIDIKRLKRVISSLPDDGKIIIQVTRNYSDRSNRSNEELVNWMKMGNVLILQCYTSV